MWSEFEWENKVAVRTTIESLRGYLDHLLKTTNMRCLTPETALEGECDFLAANLYARSVFGEDALANLSIDRTNDVVSGHIRIRSKTQGIALSLGDKVCPIRTSHPCVQHPILCVRISSSVGLTPSPTLLSSCRSH
jgi:coatomer subunit beta